MGISLYKSSGECIATASGSCQFTIYNLARPNVKVVYHLPVVVCLDAVFILQNVVLVRWVCGWSSSVWLCVQYRRPACYACREAQPHQLQWLACSELRVWKQRDSGCHCPETSSEAATRETNFGICPRESLGCSYRCKLF